MKKITAHFYRRHKRGCKGCHTEDSRSGEFEERKKGWKRCDCPISVSGTVQGKFQRKSLGVADWDAARELIADLDNWNVVPTSPPAPPAHQKRTPIEQAIEAFHKYHETSSLNTQQTYRYQIKKLAIFATSRGFVFLDQLGPTDIRNMRYSWQVSPKTARQALVIIKGFLLFCRANEWIKENPAELIRSPKVHGAREEKETLPFSDKELDRMFGACFIDGKPRKFRNYDGEDLSDFISLSMYTGLRISDIVKFHLERVKDNGDIRVRATKNGEPIYTWVPPWLTERIRARAAKYGDYIFGKQHANQNIVTTKWRCRLNALWNLCGEWQNPPTPHRFRHTFARILLQNGVPVAGVAELIGDTEEVVRRHYAAWVPERQDRLRGILQNAFTNKPMPNNVVAFPSKR